MYAQLPWSDGLWKKKKALVGVEMWCMLLHNLGVLSQSDGDSSAFRPLPPVNRPKSVQLHNTSAIDKPIHYRSCFRDIFALKACYER